MISNELFKSQVSFLSFMLRGAMQKKQAGSNNDDPKLVGVNWFKRQ